MEEKGLSNYQRATPVIMVAQSMPDKEIRLLDLWRLLWRRKMIILGTAAVVVVIAVVHALLATPIYRAEAQLLPPSLVELDGLANFESELFSISHDDQKNAKGGSPTNPYTPRRVYNAFTQNLKSVSLRRRFFDAHKLADYLATDHAAGNSRKAFDAFNKALVVSQDKTDSSRVIVSFEGKSAKLAAKWVNEFVAEVDVFTVNSLIGDANSMLEARKAMVRDSIVAKRKMAKQLCEDRIFALEEAEAIAQKLGVRKNLLEKTPMSKPPLYMRGTSVLKAEINQLRQRKNDDSFIPDLRRLQERLNMLGSVHIEPSRVSVVQVDEPAVVPQTRIKPNRRVIAILGLIGGVMLGVFAGFFAELIARAREDRDAA